ncbi:MAG: glutathione S-transferase N-terminal domain-containing protein [Gammaproteobacteria bacterium]|nr:glutathione S-transferase N-terminal domain-containing protein [Gammaproteobacteria bacterium]
MIDLYYWPTPNGWKISIMLEECGLEYRLIPVDIGRGDQFKPEFLAISPNNRMPAIVDHDVEGEPVSVFESGAILVYLAEKTGRFIPADPRARIEVMQWLFWQVGGLGPMAGQLGHFTNYAPEKIPYALNRYGDEYNRLLGVIEKQLADKDYLCGDYSIADMASWSWVVVHERVNQSLDGFPRVKAWDERMKARSAVAAGKDLGKELRRRFEDDEEARKMLFGQTAASVADVAGR